MLSLFLVFLYGPFPIEVNRDAFGGAQPAGVIGGVELCAVNGQSRSYLPRPWTCELRGSGSYQSMRRIGWRHQIIFFFFSEFAPNTDLHFRGALRPPSAVGNREVTERLTDNPRVSNFSRVILSHIINLSASPWPLYTARPSRCLLRLVAAARRSPTWRGCSDQVNISRVFPLSC